MIYDIFISLLTVTGVVGSLVYFYKISHSRVYTVGIVKRTAAPEPSVQGNDRPSAVSFDELDYALRESRPHHATIRIYASGQGELTPRERIRAEHYFRVKKASFLTWPDYEMVPRDSTEGVVKIWCCDHCGRYQRLKDDKCIGCGLPRTSSSARDLAPGTTKSLKDEGVEREKSVLRSHSERLQDFEKRIRQLELESIKKQTPPEDESLTRRQDWVQ